MNFTLTEKQEKELKKFKNKIKRQCGKYGNFDYIFTSCGIGISFEVRSHLTNETIDLSFEEDW